jgi:(2Fe-2S) ferredoxin
LFVCTNHNASGKPACGKRGGEELMAAVQQELIARGVTARVTACGCLGPCFDGPNAVVYPEGIWYGELGVEDASALADHLEHGTIYGAKRAEAPGE